MTTPDPQTLRPQQWRIDTSFAHRDARQDPVPMSLSPNQRIAQAAQHFTRLRGIPESQRDIYRQHGIHTNEPWCVNFVSAVTATAGLRPPGGAHVNNIPEIGTKVRPNDIKAGDIAVNSRHTGIVMNVHRDAAGNPTGYDLLNGNTVENGKWTVGLTKISLSNNPYQLYRHNGEPSRHAPPAVFAGNMTSAGSVFSSNLSQRVAMSAQHTAPLPAVAMAPPAATPRGWKMNTSPIDAPVPSRQG